MAASGQTKSKTNEALERWDRLAKTDPAHTKPFNRGGFSGTALKPIWLIKRMTEEFGTVGIAWGMLEPKFDTIFIPDVEPQVYCTAGIWIGTRDNTIYGVGGDTMVRKFKDGTMIADDEAFKKAYTDAINNAFKYLGIGGDVHMGQFEDSKYVAETASEFKRQASPHYDDANKLMALLEQAADMTALNKIIASNKGMTDMLQAEAPALLQSVRSVYAKKKQLLEKESS